MKNNKILLQTVQRLGKKELLRYASNIGMDPDENQSVSDLRQAYADYILSNPTALLENRQRNTHVGVYYTP